jgi:hypothetical protein
MSEFFSNLHQFYILRTIVGTPTFVFGLLHLLLLIPLNLFCLGFGLKSALKPKHIKEKRLLVGGVLMLLVIGFRLYLNHEIYVVDEGHGWNGFFKFELSEVAAYILLIATFVVKKDWLYPLAFTLGMISWFAVFAYPYTVFSGFVPFHFYAWASFVFHILNGYLAIMLVVARGYKPQKKHTAIVAVCSVFIFAFIYLMNEVWGQNFLVLHDPSEIPVINLFPVPYHIIAIFVIFQALNFGILFLCEFLYERKYLGFYLKSKHSL